MLDPDNEPGGRCGKLADNHSPSIREGRAGSLLGVVALAIVVYLGFVAVRSSAKPAISVTILGYTRQGKLLCARVSLANKGRESICYNNGGGLLGPDGWLLAESSSGWTHREIGGVILSPSLLCPGSNTVFTVVLPLDTLRWQGGFRVRAASLREWATWKLNSRWFARLYPLCRWLLPQNKGRQHEITTGLVELPLVLAPPDLWHDDQTAADDATSSRFGGLLPWDR